MPRRSTSQRVRLLELAGRVALRRDPLGIGLRNQCWGGIAVAIAKEHGWRASDYYGISFRELRDYIKDNNLTPCEKRNRHMAMRTLRLALTS